MLGRRRFRRIIRRAKIQAIVDAQRQQKLCASCDHPRCASRTPAWIDEEYDGGSWFGDLGCFINQSPTFH